MKTVLVYGKFDILHPGHVRLLNFAKECGDYLIVAVYSDKMLGNKCKIQETHRLELIQSLESVDESFITDKLPSSIIIDVRPSIVVKGKEFENQFNEEKDVLESIGGQLLFGSGDSEFAAYYMRNINKLEIGQTFDFTEIKNYAERHDISQKTISEIFQKFKNKKVCVIGEIIVDEYVQGTAIGMSQEDPTIVITPHKTDTYLGGAAITAGHIKALGAAEVSLYSVLGQDTQAEYVKKTIAQYGVKDYFFSDSSRPTPLKTRYRASSKTLLRVNQVRQHKISKEIQDNIYKCIERDIDFFDLFIFSDFNYGLLPQELVDLIVNLCHKKKVMVVADSQTSSQIGDISRYKSMDLITPTEKEVRVALNNIDDGLVVLAQKLIDKSLPTNLVLTLAEHGIFIHKPSSDFKSWQNDRLPAINRNPLDPAGAGDCFLAASSLVLCSGGDLWLASLIASFASACQVGIIGNTPLEQSVVENLINEAFK